MKITITIKDTNLKDGSVSMEMTFAKPVDMKAKQTPACVLALHGMKAIAEEVARRRGKIEDVTTTGL